MKKTEKGSRNRIRNSENDMDVKQSAAQLLAAVNKYGAEAASATAVILDQLHEIADSLDIIARLLKKEVADQSGEGVRN